MNPERTLGHESIEAYSSKIELRFLRHEEKAKSNAADETIPLTKEGSVRAKALAGAPVTEGLSQTAAFGSPRKRARQTAALAMSGNEEGVTGEESFEDLTTKLDEGLGYGSKVNTDSRLDYTYDDNSMYGKKANEAYAAGKLLDFVVHESDALAKELGDRDSSTYSRQAGGIASIVEKYIQMAPRWDALVNDPSKDYETDLKRLFGTHQTISESFVAKVIEMTKGIPERDAFVASLKGKGVGYGEGFRVEIVTPEGGGDPKILVHYKKDGATPEESFEFNEEIPEELVKTIAAAYERRASEEVVAAAVERSRELQPVMEGFANDFHENPELGGQELETSKKIQTFLESLDIEIVGNEIGLERPGALKPSFGTGIIGYIKGKEGGPTIALRADMDALPVKEDPKNPHASKKEGLMHACGHDMHSAGLMGAAQVLKELADKGELEGNVVLVFQPSEEKTFQKESGAVQMVNFLERSGLRDEIKAFFGIHVIREMDRGEYSALDGMVSSSSGEIDIKLEAPGGHVMNAYELPNLNAIFSEINVRLDKLFAPYYERKEGVIASTRTNFPSGGYNVLPASGESTWVVRISSELYKKISQDVLRQMKEVVAEVVAEKGKQKVDVTIKNRAGYRPIVHRDKDLTAVARDSAGESIENSKYSPKDMLGAGEDFSFYLESLRGKQIPGVFLMVGGANTAKGIPKGPHHTPDFRIDPEVLSELAASHATFTLNAIELLKA